MKVSSAHVMKGADPMEGYPPPGGYYPSRPTCLQAMSQSAPSLNRAEAATSLLWRTAARFRLQMHHLFPLSMKDIELLYAAMPHKKPTLCHEGYPGYPPPSAYPPPGYPPQPAHKHAVGLTVPLSDSSARGSLRSTAYPPVYGSPS